MEKQQLLDLILDWENEAGESFNDYFTADVMNDRDWAGWLIEKGFIEIANEILDECSNSPFNWCTDQSLKFGIYPEYEDEEFNYDHYVKNLELVCEYILFQPILLKKCLEFFKENGTGSSI